MSKRGRHITATFNIACWLATHSSEIRGLCLMKWPSEMLQNLPYFWNTKSHIVFFVFHFELLWICYSGCSGQSKVARNGGTIWGFSYYIFVTIWQVLKHFSGTFCRASNYEIMRSVYQHFNYITPEISPLLALVMDRLNQRI